VEDPNLIEVGWKLCIPAAGVDTAAMDAGTETAEETVSTAETFTETPVTLDNGIAAIVTQPAGAENVPAVLMLHGFGSEKNEVGEMYKRLAAALAEQGIASLRIDYRGWGESAGDMAESTIQGHAADAETAYNYLTSLDFVDPARVGVVGFSLGGGIAIISGAEHPDWYESMVVWSSVGDFVPDFIGVLGQESFAQAAQDGVATVDLGWREVTLNDAFFKSLEDYDLQELIASYPGAFLTIAGSEDFSADYVDSFAANAPGSVKEVWVIEGGDHIYGVLGEDQTMADSVIDKTVQWFGETL
jgi:pimeloyl-ACP methyl ester carboxylesterase